MLGGSREKGEELAALPLRISELPIELLAGLVLNLPHYTLALGMPLTTLASIPDVSTGSCT